MSATPIGAKNYAIPTYLPGKDPAAFNRALLGALSGQPQTRAVGYRKDPGPGTQQREIPPTPVTFGAHEPEEGIYVYVAESNVLVPFQYYRRTEFGYDTNEEWQAQLAATPWLDPKAFGTRPGAPGGADRALQPGQKIIVLDSTRLDYLEQQRTLLNGIDRTPGNSVERETRDDQVTQLADLIFSEVDYATLGQAVPDFDSVIGNIRVRAPDDPLFQRAINLAQSRLEAKWKSEGRTSDKLGEVLKAGEAGDFGKVRSLTKDQFVAMIDALGPKATPAQIQAEIVRLTGVYTTYLTGDEGYKTAILGGAGDAGKTLLVDRPVKAVLDIARAGGDDWANDSIAKLRELLTTQNYTPDQVIAIMSDPGIQKLIRQGLRHADSYDAADEGRLPALEDQADVDLFKDISAIYSTALYADRNIGPGVVSTDGKKLVDNMAQFVVDNTIVENGMPALGMTYGSAMQFSAADGHVALALAIGAKANGVKNSAFNELNRPEYYVSLGIRDFREKFDELQKKIGEDSAFLQLPLASVGGQYLTPEKRMQIIDGLLEAFPKDANTLNSDLEQLSVLNEGRERVQFALDAYQGNYQTNGGFKATQTELAKIPTQPADAGIESTNPLWFLRANRLALDATIRATLPSVGGSDAFQRGSRGISTVFFALNANALIGGPVEDWIFAPVHTMMAASHGTQALLGEDWSKRLYGETPNGHADTIYRRSTDGLEARVNAWNINPTLKKTMVTLGKGAILDPLDVAYIGIDGYNAWAYFSGNTKAGEHDLVRGFAYTTSLLSDASLIVGTGLTAVGSGATLLGFGAAAWTGVGIGLMLIASGANYVKGLYDHAHAFDEQTAKAWELLGIRNRDVAKYLGIGATFADGDSYKNAGPFLIEMFRHAGYTPEQMVDFINQNWTPEQADRLATDIKRVVTRSDDGSYSDEDFAFVESYAESVGIKVPDYYNESNTPFKPDPNAPPAWEWTGP